MSQKRVFLKESEIISEFIHFLIKLQSQLDGQPTNETIKMCNLVAETFKLVKRVSDNKEVLQETIQFMP